jgi:protoporphyrinogen oxidase
LRFRPLSFAERLRFGLNVALYRSAHAWKRLEGTPARDWLRARFGERAYEVIWEPLLRIKFGPHADEVTAAWMWHRIHRLARSRPHVLAREQLGFLRGGTDVLLARLIGALRERGVGLHTRATVEAIAIESGSVRGLNVAGVFQPYDAVVSTVALPILARLLPAAPAEWLAQLRSIEYLAVACVLFRLKEPLTDGFWVNVNDPAVSFNGFVEYTNLNSRPDAGSPHLVYVPFYLPPGEALQLAPRTTHRGVRARLSLHSAGFRRLPGAGRKRVPRSLRTSRVHAALFPKSARAAGSCGRLVSHRLHPTLPVRSNH